MSNDYPSGMTLRPIEAWPGVQTINRVRSQFSAPWSATLDLLDRELYYLGSGRRRAPSVLQIAMRERDFRIDGMPRANAVPAHPGVILSIESSKGSLSFPCDKFDRWRDNLRAIALGLEALRRIDRYGITPGNEQYHGWRAIEQKASSQTVDAACLVLATYAHPNERAENRAEWAPKIAVDQTLAAATYRKARGNAHPDRNDGDRVAWDDVERAAETLRTAGVEGLR